MVEATAFLAAAILLGFGTRRVASALQVGADPAHRYLSGFALCMGASLITLDPANLVRLGHLMPGPAAVLLGDALKTASLTFVQCFAVSLAPESASQGARTTAQVLRVAYVVQLASAALMVLAHPLARNGSLILHGVQARIMLGGYDALFTGYALWCVFGLGAVLVFHLRQAGPGLLRFCLRLAVAAVAAGMMWTAWSLDDIRAALVTGTQDGGEDGLSNLLGMLCVLPAVAGATAPLWSSRLAPPLRWWRAYRRHRALEPLWSALHAQFPEIALAPHVRWHGFLPWHAEFALYRRIIEIRDGQLALRPYLEPVPEAKVAEPSIATAQCLPAAAEHEAAALAAALANHRLGRRRVTERDNGPALRQVPATVDGEAVWLVHVARALAAGQPPRPAWRMTPLCGEEEAVRGDRLSAADHSGARQRTDRGLHDQRA